MAFRTVTIDGQAWRVFPSGFVTQYDRDEFGLMFVHGDGDARDVRVTRYSPKGARSREQAFIQLSDADLVRLFHASQPGFT
jgi:hypothetical protein